MTYELVTAPVLGGVLTAGLWNADARRTVLALHGITASHRAWLAIAEHLPGVRVIAPDLRGRGGSRDLPAPFGMAQHAEDAAGLLDSLGADRVHVVGHSMGGFVAMRFAELFPQRVASVTLVDGGIPLPLPADVPIDEVMHAALGPAIARLSVTYPSAESYRKFWRAHPAFARDWTADVENYVDYDLVGEPPELRSSAAATAVLADAVEQGVGTVADRPWRVVTAPITFLRAERGMMDGPEGLYPAEYVAAWAAAHPKLEVIEVAGANHYTIVMNHRGADAVVAAINIDREAVT